MSCPKLSPPLSTWPGNRRPARWLGPGFRHLPNAAAIRICTPPKSRREITRPRREPTAAAEPKSHHDHDPASHMAIPRSVGELFRPYDHELVQEMLTEILAGSLRRRPGQHHGSKGARPRCRALTVVILWLPKAAHGRSSTLEALQMSHSGRILNPVQTDNESGAERHQGHIARYDRSNASAPRVTRSRASFVGVLLKEAKADPHCRYPRRAAAGETRARTCSEAKNCAGLAPRSTRSAP